MKKLLPKEINPLIGDEYIIKPKSYDRLVICVIEKDSMDEYQFNPTNKMMPYLWLKDIEWLIPCTDLLND